MLRKAQLSLISFLLITATFVVGCQAENKSSFVYEKEFKTYLDSTFAIKTTDRDIFYYIFPITSCDYCSQKSYEVLSSLPNQKRFVLVLVGNPQNPPVEEINFFKLPFVKLHDINEDAYRFGFGLAKPMLIRMKNNHCIFGKEITDDLIDQLPKMIE